MRIACGESSIRPSRGPGIDDDPERTAFAGKTGSRRCWPSRGFDGSIVNCPRKVFAYGTALTHQACHSKRCFYPTKRMYLPPSESAAHVLRHAATKTRPSRPLLVRTRIHVARKT